ncbi:MAG: lamin tail domain-containing protein [Planctomycetes bacterium]|nr:lamin tail domain-containing protein [Planctomycetota bacterium]
MTGTSGCLSLVFFLVFFFPALARAGVRLSELLYHPLDDRLEFVELYNDGPAAADLSGWQFTDGIYFVFPDGATIPAQGLMVVARNVDALAAATGLSPAELFGNTFDALSNGGERVALADAGGQVVEEVTYSDRLPFDPAADSGGRSLERLCFSAPADWPGNWRASASAGGTPLAANSASACPPPFAPVFSPVVVNEIHYHPPGAGDPGEEYLELYNRAGAAADLQGWRLAGGIDYLFDAAAGPASIPAGGYLLVGKNPAALAGLAGLPAAAIAGPYLKKLSNFKDEIILLDPDGRELERVEYSQDGLWPARADGLGGSLQRISAEVSGLLPQNWKVGADASCAPVKECVFFQNGAPVRWFENRSGFDPGFTGGAPWYDPAFDDVQNGWKDGNLAVGYDTVASSAPGWINTPSTSVAGLHSILLRLEFDFDPASFPSCSSPAPHLYADWDDGFIAWLNGAEIARGGMTDPPGTVPPFDGSYRAQIITARGDTAREPVYQLVWTGAEGSLKPGRNVLAIGNYNSRSTSGDLFLSARLTLGEAAVLSDLTPGAANSVAAPKTPPLIAAVDWLPVWPKSSESIAVAARVEGEDIGEVLLHFDAGAGDQAVPMRDDGQAPDAAAGDGTFSAPIPPQPNLTLVRVQVEARNSLGCSTRFPRKGNPSPHTGYLVSDSLPAAGDPVRLYYIFTPGALRDLSCADGVYRQGNLVDYRGRAHFDVGVKNRGETACGYPKIPMRVRFNKGDLLDGQEHLNFNAGWQDKSMIREQFAFDFFRAAGAAYSETHFARVHTNNGAFFGAFFTIEDPSGEYLRRNRQDPDGGLYKCRTAMLTGGTSGYEPQTDGGVEKLPAVGSFASKLNSSSGQALIDHLNANLNVEEFFDYQAVQVIIIDGDSVVKNWLLHVGQSDFSDVDRDLFSMYAWDCDLTYGQMLLTTDVRNTNIHPLFQTQSYPFHDQGYHGIINAVLQRAPDDYYVKAFYGRTWALLQEKFNPAALLPKVNAFDEATRQTAQEDLNKWPRTWGARGTDLAYWRNDFRAFIQKRFDFLTAYLTADNPTSLGRRFQYTPAPRVKMVEINYHPTGDEELEFIEFKNFEAAPVDLSGWDIPAVQFVFPAGSAAPAEGLFLVAENPQALRAAYGDPGVPVFGPYAGQLKNGGETARLRDGGQYRGKTYYPETIDVVTYRDDPPWPQAADGEGRTLELKDLSLDNDEAESWQASPAAGGSPGGLQGSNRPPVASLVINPREGFIPLSVSFDASASRDPDRDPLEIAWDFGDGVFALGELASHIYTRAGTFRGVVSVSDGSHDPVLQSFEIKALEVPRGYFIRGDVNSDADLNIADPVRLLLALFAGLPITCREAAEVFDDGQLDLSDVIALLQYLFLRGSPLPPAPFPACGPDPDPPGLGCEAGACKN